MQFFLLKTGWRQRGKTKLASKNKNKRFAITKDKYDYHCQHSAPHYEASG